MVSYLPLVVYCDVQHDFRKNKQKIYSVSFYLELFAGGLMFYLRYFCLCALSCQFLLIFHSWLPVRFSLTFIYQLLLIFHSWLPRSVFSNIYLPVSLDFPFLIAPSVFSNVYLPVSLDFLFLMAPSVFSNVYLPVSLDFLFLIAPSVFSNVYLYNVFSAVRSIYYFCFYVNPSLT